jgi:hypothetical protein
LTGLKAYSSGERRARPAALGATALLCLFLLALLAVVQVAHIHPLESDADHCPLCVSMHSAAPVPVLAAAVVMVQVETRTPVFEARVVIRHWNPKLFTRPPPAGC